MNFSVIYNPIATKFSQRILDHLIFKFVERGLTLNKVCKSEYAGHVIKLIKELDPVSDYIITLGGDGTVSEAFNAFKDIEQHCVYGHISVGTTNDMANNFNLFKRNALKSVDKLATEGIETEMDSIMCNGEIVSYVSSFGYVAPVPYLTNGALKKKIGHAAYVVSALPILAKKPVKTKIRYTANGETKEVYTTLALITNSKGMGGVVLYPNVDRNDGKFEVFFLNQLSPKIIPGLFSHYLTDTINLSDYAMYGDFITTDKLDITFTGQPLKHTLDNDGEKFPHDFTLHDNTVHYEIGKKIKILMPEK